MAARHLINVDLAKVYKSQDKKGFVRTLGWGDEVEVVRIARDHIEVKITEFVELEDGSIKPQRASGFIVPPKSIKPADVVIKKSESRILKVDFVDVQQGDGCVIESPQGKVVLIDGGDNQLFARYLANRFRGSSADRPKEIDCILVTHGDADHFAGLVEIHKSESEPRLERQSWKRLFIHPQRVYHNGLVKRPSKINGRPVKATDLLGKTRKAKDPETRKEITVITGLEEDLLKVDRKELNKPFQMWQDALRSYRKRGPIRFRRLEAGDDDAFDFLADEGIGVEVLAPILVRAGNIEGLKFLGNPPKGPRIGQESLSIEDRGFGGFSASHTINGHSVVFRLVYGSFNFLFSGDLNDESERILTRAHNRGDLNLQAEVFKVPHHGSADFSGAFVQAVSPVISVVSSGDESARKEFIHPRATLMGTLGKYSRIEEPLIFVTELVAFFQMEGYITPECHKTRNGEAVIKDGVAVIDEKARKKFFSFSRAAFGIVMVRTDGERLLVYTHSGQSKLKEAYAYRVNEFGRPEPVPVRQV